MSAPLDSRVIRIIRWLLDQSEPRRTADLADDLGLSQRIVRYRLAPAENYLRGWGATLERRRGSGLLLVVDDDTREAIRDDLVASSEAPRVYSPEERSRLLLVALLWAAPGLASLDDIHEELGVSKTSARRDLQLSEPWLERNGLPVVRRPGKGVGVVGTERRVRQVIVQLLLESLPPGLIDAHVRNSVEEHESLASRVPIGLRERLQELPVAEVADVIRASSLGGRLTSGPAGSVFALYLAVTVARVREGHAVDVEAGLQRSVMDHPVASNVRELIPALERLLEGALEPAEVGAITEYWLGLDTVQDERPVPTLDGWLIHELLAMAGDALHSVLADDRELRSGLGAHLERLAVRLRHGLPIHNPLLADVRARYPDVHAVARQLAERISEAMDAPIHEDEVGFLTMYLSGAMERARLRPRRRVLVVCPSGMAMAWVLVSRIQAEFPEFDLVEVLSAEGYESLDHRDFDLVITTVPLPENAAPVVVVHPLLPAGDVGAVRAYA